MVLKSWVEIGEIWLHNKKVLLSKGDSVNEGKNSILQGFTEKPVVVRHDTDMYY